MTIKQLIARIDQGTALKEIALAYTEIASNRLKKIRVLVEKNRNFLDELAVVYKVVKQKARLRNALKPKNNKTVSIIITSNYHFFGNVNQNLASFFADNMRAHRTPPEAGQADQIVIGKTAQEYLQSVNYTLPYTFLTFKKDYPESAELDMLVSKIKDYSQILVFFSRMKTVMFQMPSYQDITQTAYLQTQPQEDPSKTPLFIFEPELTKILDFFETQGLSLLLQQAFLESELAKTASRLVSMDQSQTNADKFIKQYIILLNQAKKTLANTRLLETFTSIILEKNQKENFYG